MQQINLQLAVYKTNEEEIRKSLLCLHVSMPIDTEMPEGLDGSCAKGVSKRSTELQPARVPREIKAQNLPKRAHTTPINAVSRRATDT